MSSIQDPAAVRWIPSVYRTESLIKCSLQTAWRCLLDYPQWNPSFRGAEIIAISGNPRSEGEVVLIRKPITDVTGAPLPEFFAETVKLRPQEQIVWYVYPKDGISFFNFVDFRIGEFGSRVKFDINYYAQDLLPIELLLRQREEYTQFFCELAEAFKAFCESAAPEGPSGALQS